jgi:signal transduction histidine kinase
VADRRVLSPTIGGLVRGLAVARVVAVVWIVVAWATVLHRFRRPELALAVVLVVVLATCATVSVAFGSPRRLLDPAVVLIEVALVACVVVLDGAAWPSGQLFTVRQSLAGALPLVTTLAAAVALGPSAGALGGALGLLRGLAAVVNGSALHGGRLTSVLASAVFGATAGIVGGWVADRLRAAEEEVSITRAQEQLFRSVHDTVLQTLAVVAQTGSGEVAALAKRTDRELRYAVFGPAPTDASFAAAVQRAARTAATRVGVEVTVAVVAEDEPAPSIVLAVAGAVGEAVSNAGRHGHPNIVTVFAEVEDDGTVRATVRDDGVGFDVPTTRPGTGIASSITGRIEDVGGRVDIRSAPGDGCLVSLVVPPERMRGAMR